MKKSKLFLAVAFGAVLFTSCSSDDDGGSAPLGEYDNGIFVLNEGDGVSGSVTFMTNDLTTVEQDVFFNVNGNAQSIGGYNQSMFFDGDKAYIISGAANKVTVVNRYTFEYIGTVSTGLANPRYGVAYNGKAYVTNLNTFDSSTDDYITVINLSDLSVEAPIPVNDYADHIVEHDGKLFVANGSFGLGTNITVIDAATGAITQVIPAGQSPNSMEVSGNVVFVLCGSLAGDSKMVRIGTTQFVEDTDDFVYDSVTFNGALGNAQNLDIENNRAYFTVGAKIYRAALNAVAVNDTPLIDTGSTSPYIGYGFAVKGNRIFIAEAASDFASDGKIFIYPASGGDVLAEKPAGLGPNSFYFN